MNTKKKNTDASSAHKRVGPDSVSILNGIQPPRPERAVDQIVESIRVAIAAGRLNRGDRMPNERDMADEFGVSQPTIRESLRVLEAMGLVNVRRGSGAFVAANSQEFVSLALKTLTQMENIGITDVIDLRLCIAPYSAARAAKHATPENLANIEALDQQLAEASATGNFGNVAPLILALSASMSAASHHPLLFSIESFLAELMVAFFVAAWRKNPATFTEHWVNWTAPSEGHRRQIIKAFRAGDETAAARAMSAHVEYQIRILKSFPELADVKIGEPTISNALSEVAFKAPEYRDALGSGGSGDNEIASG